MRCRSGKHEWINPISAERCCDPRWRQELRYGMDNIQPGDEQDGITVLRNSPGWIKVWRRVDAD
jgi:hypothetical protein